MRSKKMLLIICSIIFLLIASIYFFYFTYKGQLIRYDVFGGNDLHLVSEEKELYWFDVMHRNDPSAPIFLRIENEFSDYHPDLVLVEGGWDTFEGSRDEALCKGESAFTAYLAKENGVIVQDIEPSYEKQIEYLQTQYPADSILAMYLIRELKSALFLDDNSHINMEQLLLDNTILLKENGLHYSGTTIDDIYDTMNVYLPESISSSNWRNINKFKVASIMNQNKDISVIYDATIDYRNLYVGELITEMKTKYNRIFIVMGGAHLDAMRKKLQEIYS